MREKLPNPFMDQAPVKKTRKHKGPKRKPGNRVTRRAHPGKRRR